MWRLIISHSSLTLFSIDHVALRSSPSSRMPHLNIPPKTVIRKLPQAYGFNEGRFKYDANANCFNRIDLEQVPNFEDNLYNIPQKSDF